MNVNGLIDAYDISAVATRLEGGAHARNVEKVEGNITLTTAKRSYTKGETVEIQVKGIGLKAVNALSFALPYNPADYEFVGIEAGAVKDMHNMTNDRLHTVVRKHCIRPLSISVIVRRWKAIVTCLSLN